MSTRSLIGVLNADGHSYRARFCHFDGYPHHQVPQLGYALHHGHDDNVDRLTAELLRKEWSVIDPPAATQAERDAQTRGARPSHVQPLAGVGFYYTDVEDDEDPLEGDLAEEPEMAYEWLYLFTGEFLRVFFHQSSDPRGGRWASFSDFPLSELATITSEAITRRFHTRH